MAQLDTLDLVVLVLLLVGSVAYFTKGVYWAKPKDPYANIASPGNAKNGASRNIVEAMEESGRNCVIFYGSQTGTAEDYASRLAKEAGQRFGLKAMTADLEEYDFDSLDTFPEGHVAFFVMATYGEGEPTDNAVDFTEFLGSDDSTFSQGQTAAEKPLSKMRYVAFGLGNNTYEHYNAMVKKTCEALQKLGAKQVGEAGEGDDGAGTMEEDFLAWKEPMWKALAEEMKLEEREAVYEPAFEVIEKPDMDHNDEKVFLGEPNKRHLEGETKGPFNANNPFVAAISESRELFQGKQRNCIHAEIDISGSNLSYTTGDHLAVWPSNPGVEVKRFLDILNLTDKRNTVIAVKGIEPTAKVPFPTPTTYDAAARYYMEICAPISRQFIATLAPFAPNEELHQELSKMGSDKAYFQEKISKKYLNIAQFLGIASKGEKWTKIPFSLFIEGMLKLQPRYYSISSSSLVQQTKISITAVVESVTYPGAPHIVKGVATNYIKALKDKQAGVKPTDDQSYSIEGPRKKYNEGVNVLVHVRGSNFKLPSDPSIPIIMVGPGTGVAPFRGFIQERAAQARAGEKVGMTMLFFGCRKRDEDFLYADEWKQYEEALGENFKMINAFSREGKDKVYVQHRIKEHADEVNKLLDNKAFFYVCGDAAKMAREVNQIIGKIIAEHRGLPESKGEEIVKKMRSSNQYQEDVWS